MLDVLSTEDGSVTKHHHFRPPPTHIPVISAYGDTLGTSSNHNLPRVLIGSFLAGFKAIYQAVYKAEIDIEVYGKPQLEVFRFT